LRGCRDAIEAAGLRVKPWPITKEPSATASGAGLP